MAEFEIYKGKGQKQKGIKLPPLPDTKKLSDAEHYIASEGLKSAVNVAVSLGQPLLLTGEPGTGKTQLAKSVAHELDLGDPLQFNTKSVSVASDLFYHYDSLKHFHAAQVKTPNLDIKNYIRMEALGVAILKASGNAEAQKLLSEEDRTTQKVRSVVLIDEVDKAPRDLPNDILNELETMQFTIRETGQTIGADDEYKPILIITSNSEKNLPEAFLRRCVYYHIEFPDQTDLEKIVQGRLSLSKDFTKAKITEAIKHFLDLRERHLRKKPATAELLAWITILDKLQMDFSKPLVDQKKKLAESYAVLAKNQEDRDAFLNR